MFLDEFFSHLDESVPNHGTRGKRIAEQIVDFPVSRWRPLRVSFRIDEYILFFQLVFMKAWMSLVKGVFSTFLSIFFLKCEVGSALESGCPPVSAHPRWRLSSRMRPCRTPSSGSSSSTISRARPTTGTDVLVCPPGFLLWASRLSGSELRMRRGVFYYWHKLTRASTYDLPPLPPG